MYNFVLTFNFRLVSGNNRQQEYDSTIESKGLQEHQSTYSGDVYRLDEEEDEAEADNLDDNHCDYRALYEEAKEKINKLDSKLEVQLNVS